MGKQHACYIFAAGEQYGPPPEMAPGSFVIAADGGYAYLRAHQVAPDLVVGDFDSLQEPPPAGPDTIVLPQEKDDTDMVAALRAGWGCGYRAFHIYGGTGGRLDHTLANIQCIADLAVRGGRGFLYGRDTVITAIAGGRVNFDASARGILSAFAHSDTVTGVYEVGLKYALADATLRNTYPMGVSNEFTGVESSVSVGRGTLVLIYPTDVREVEA